MSTWQLEALDLCREARARATEMSNIELHQACGRAIEAMVSEGASVPGDLQNYSRDVRRIHGIPMGRVAAPSSAAYME